MKCIFAHVMRVEIFTNSRFGWITFQMERRGSICNTQPDVGLSLTQQALNIKMHKYQSRKYLEK